ncbi:DUF5872 domain-containing protein [Pyxidicoccus sp. 3LFB2]
MAARKRSRTPTSRTSPRKPATARKRASASGAKYTKPELRERIKERVKRGSKGGRPGQWSARKAQLVAAEYKKAGGGYGGDKGAKQKSLESWGQEEWQTKEGATRARRGSTTSRYLPKKAWAKLSPAQKQATERKKRTGSRGGKQFVRNTAAAKRARKKAAR